MQPDVQALLICAHQAQIDHLQQALAEYRTVRVHATPTHSLEEACRQLAAVPFDAVLLCLPTAGPVALSSLGRLRAQFPEVPVIVIAPDSDEELGLQAMRQGAQEFLNATDVTSAQLGRAVRYAVERAQTERQVRRSEQHYRTVAENTPVMIWMCNSHGECTFVNRRWQDLTGLPTTSAQGRGWLAAVDSRELKNVAEVFQTHLEQQTSFAVEFRFVHVMGHRRWVMLTCVPQYNAAGGFTGFSGTCIDITDRKQAEEHLIRRAYYDPLTNLPNRDMFNEHLARAMARRNGPGRTFLALLFIDLDGFKEVNDQHGHLVGDRLLVLVAQRLRHTVRPEDLVARLGGDEFVVLLENLHSHDELVAIVARIRLAFEQAFELEEMQVDVRASIGTAIDEGQFTKPEALIKAADDAMYRIKNSRR